VLPLCSHLAVGKDAVVGGDRATKFAVLRNRFLPERVKAERHARRAPNQLTTPTASMQMPTGLQVP